MAHLFILKSLNTFGTKKVNKKFMMIMMIHCARNVNKGQLQLKALRIFELYRKMKTKTLLLRLFLLLSPNKLSLPTL